MSDDNDLIEYETEAEEQQPSAYDAVEVCVQGEVVTVPTVPQHLSAYTVVVDTDEDGGVAEVLPQDALRVRATLTAWDQPVVVCHSRAQAMSVGNTAVMGSGAWPIGGGYDSGVQVTPTAGTDIATIAAADLPAGWYLVRIFAGYGSTAEATTDFNMDVRAGTALLANQLMVGPDSVVRSWTFDRVYLDGAQALTVEARSNASVGSIYLADITATPVQLLTPARPGGYLLPAGQSIEIGQIGPVWIAAASSLGGRVSIKAERRSP